jgi:hypothetical protein
VNCDDDAVLEPQCPLCRGRGRDDSWLGATEFDSRRFYYRTCRVCDSLFCDPMPDAETLAKMYSIEYVGVRESPDVPCGMGDGSKGVTETASDFVFRSLSPGFFVDYGCGDGSVLRSAKAHGWEAAGIEFGRDVAAAVSRETGVPVFPREDVPEALIGRAQVVHLGDVIEHLTDVDTEFERVFSLLAPGGWIAARGPLENNRNLFQLVISLSRRLRRAPPAHFPPYHVVLATTSGQRALFQRLGLQEKRWLTEEAAWPAPERLSRDAVRHPRAVGLLGLRRGSQLLSKLGAGRGNRYVYLGTRP